jgi:hypothetical protein
MKSSAPIFSPNSSSISSSFDVRKITGMSDFCRSRRSSSMPDVAVIWLARMSTIAVGPALATVMVASVGDPRAFRSGRDFSAWSGLVPKQNSSGGKEKLGSISKRGDRYLRSLFTIGALAVIRYAKLHGTKQRPWLTALLDRNHSRIQAARNRRDPMPWGDRSGGAACRCRSVARWLGLAER